MKSYFVAAVISAGLVAGCASPGDRPEFRDVKGKPMVSEITVTSRVLDSVEAVRTECYMRARTAGIKTTPNPTAPACSWREPHSSAPGGFRIVMLSVKAKSFNDHIVLESKGHELEHWHEGIDHE